MMAAPARKPRVTRPLRTFIDIAPRAATLLLWESFLRHEVTPNTAKKARVSVSFNYGWR